MDDYEKHLDHWKEVCEQPLYQFLRHDPTGRRILELLFDQRISIGKAAQSIVEKYCFGIDPVLPETEEESCERD